MILLLLSLACAHDRPSEIRFEPGEAKALFQGFSANEDLPELPPSKAFSARRACPQLSKARYTPGEESFGMLQVWGDGVERVQVLAALSGGLVGEAPPHHEEDGSVRFAVGCRSCELILGQRVEGIPVGCQGPGHSIYLQRGKLVSLPKELQGEE